MQAEPVVIRGRKYKSVKHAARRLGVTEVAIYNARRRGSLDNVGLGKGCHLGPRDGMAKPLDLGFKKFRSKAEASRYIGRANNYVSMLMRRGDFNSLAQQFAAAYQAEKAKHNMAQDAERTQDARRRATEAMGEGVQGNADGAVASQSQ